MGVNNSQLEENGSTNNPHPDHNSSKKTWVPKSRPCPRKRCEEREHSPDRNEAKFPRIEERTSEEEGGLEDFQPAEQCQQPMPNIASTSSYVPPNGNPLSDCYNVTLNQMMTQYDIINPSAASVISSMPSSMNMASTSSGMNPFPYVIPANLSMYGMMASIPGYCPITLMNGTLPSMPPKVMKTFPSCTLVPPPPGAPAPSRRNRPNGCKTVFVGGLPEKITEDIIKEAFSDCGEISTVRMTKKNFCHIRFVSQDHVDQAMFFSGYRIKIENKDEPGYSSRLHVDFAIARDDQSEYESLMRTLSREARHANDDIRPPSPPPIANYSDDGAVTVRENLCNKETFQQASNVLITWLKRGECNKRNAATFYSMIENLNILVRKLVGEKIQVEDELTTVKLKLRKQLTSNAVYFNDIEKVFTYALAQKVWDHFTKFQRKHIDQWKQQTFDTKMRNSEDLLEERIEEEMDISDNEDEGESSELKEELVQLHENQVALLEENELLRNQLRTTNNEKVSLTEESVKKLTALTDTYLLMQQNYLETKEQLEEALKEKFSSGDETKNSLKKSQMCVGNCPSTSSAENEARLVSLIASFLISHPLGTSIDNICYYLAKMDRNINWRDVENLMKKFNTVFKEESTGIGATLEKKWIYYGHKFYTSTKSEAIF